MKLNVKTSIAFLVIAVILFSLGVYFEQRVHIDEETWSLDVAPESVGW